MDKTARTRSKRKFDIIMLIIILAVIGYLALPVPRCKPINYDSGRYEATSFHRATVYSINILHNDYINKGTKCLFLVEDYDPIEDCVSGRYIGEIQGFHAGKYYGDSFITLFYESKVHNSPLWKVMYE